MQKLSKMSELVVLHVMEMIFLSFFQISYVTYFLIMHLLSTTKYLEAEVNIYIIIYILR